MQPLHNTEPRYFIPASGVIQVVSIETPAPYDTRYRHFSAEVQQWKALTASKALLGPATQALLDQMQLARKFLG